MRRDDGAKQYQGRDPDQAEQNGNAKSKHTKNCIPHVWLWGWYFVVRPCGFILNCRPLFISESNHQTKCESEITPGFFAQEKSNIHMKLHDLAVVSAIPKTSAVAKKTTYTLVE